MLDTPPCPGYNVGMPKVSTTNELTDVAAEGDPALRLGRLLHLAQKRSARILRAELEPFGITPVQFVVLSELYQHDGRSLNAIAERMSADPPTVSGVVDCLVTGGYVERRPDPQDRRRLRLFITEKARAIEADLKAANERRQRVITQLMTAEESELLRELLLRIIRATDAGAPPRGGASTSAGEPSCR